MILNRTDTTANVQLLFELLDEQVREFMSEPRRWVLAGDTIKPVTPADDQRGPWLEK